jgi:pyruvate formate-lyase activating enzyme-like uncharacterized protein
MNRNNLGESKTISSNQTTSQTIDVNLEQSTTIEKHQTTSKRIFLHLCESRVKQHINDIKQINTTSSKSAQKNTKAKIKRYFSMKNQSKHRFCIKRYAVYAFRLCGIMCILPFLPVFKPRVGFK